MSNLSDFVPSGDGGGVGSRYVSEVHNATSGQTVFDLSNSYTLGYSSLVVCINGAEQAPKSSAYAETNTKRVTLSEGVNAGDEVVFRILQTLEE
ncbi:hypothetical protein [Bacterioplanoides sp.]|uniref:hypothetical protein n=1 Tax=Bacterioplanoides sp. TaxID=2066072 RepID=UPI003B598F92